MNEMQGLRVLVADDEKYNRAFLKILVSRMNCEIVGEAADGHETLRLFEETEPDLLLLDINMPFKTGEEVLQEIIAKSPDAFVIMLTSVVEIDSIRKCIDLGAANYVLKDTPPKEMMKIVYETWRNRKGKKGESGGPSI